MSNRSSRVSSEPGSPSHGPSGETRRGRRERERAHNRTRTETVRRKSFVERYRGTLLGLAAVAAVVLVGGFVVVQANSKAYACSSETVPAAVGSPLPNGSAAALGQVQTDMGRNHILAPEAQRYVACPPASGNHYAGLDGPIKAQYYTPDDATLPQGWIHNLEHGGLVILYNCNMGACDDATQKALQDLYQTFPNSPLCGIPKGTISPVIARFDDMKAPIAALLWGRVLFQDKLDTAQILDYYATQAELKNPEPQCARPTATPATPATSPNPSTAPATSASPATSTGPEPSTSPIPSASPAASPARPDRIVRCACTPTERDQVSIDGGHGRGRAADRRPARA